MLKIFFDLCEIGSYSNKFVQNLQEHPVFRYPEGPGNLMGCVWHRQLQLPSVPSMANAWHTSENGWSFVLLLVEWLMEQGFKGRPSQCFFFYQALAYHNQARLVL